MESCTRNFDYSALLAMGIRYGLVGDSSLYTKRNNKKKRLGFYLGGLLSWYVVSVCFFLEFVALGIWLLAFRRCGFRLLAFVFVSFRSWISGMILRRFHTALILCNVSLDSVKHSMVDRLY